MATFFPFFFLSKVLEENFMQMNNLIPEKTKRRTFTVSQHYKNVEIIEF